MEMRYLKTFESFNSEEVNEGLFGNVADKIKGAFKDKTPEKIALAFAEAQKGVLTDDLKKAYAKLKEQDNLFPINVIAGGGKNPGMAPNLYAAIDKNNKEAIKNITDVEIAKVFLQSKSVKKDADDVWVGTGRGSAEGVTGAQGAYSGNK
jgi:hypothetical protein